jgi:hypothetical protein
MTLEFKNWFGWRLSCLIMSYWTCDAGSRGERVPPNGERQTLNAERPS